MNEGNSLGQGYNRPTGCSAVRPHTRPFKDRRLWNVAPKCMLKLIIPCYIFKINFLLYNQQLHKQGIYMYATMQYVLLHVSAVTSGFFSSCLCTHVKWVTKQLEKNSLVTALGHGSHYWNNEISFPPPNPQTNAPHILYSWSVSWISTWRWTTYRGRNM